MDAQPTVRALLHFGVIVLAATPIFVTPAFAVAQSEHAGFIAAASADSIGTEESPQITGYTPQSSDDSAVQSQSNSKKSPPPDVHGTWCGPMNDNFFGAGSISIALGQRGSKLTGSWTASMAGSGSLKGKITGSAVTMTLRQQGSHCRALVHGTLVQPGEITGSYNIFGCQQPDAGTFDITSPNC